jgi:nicotinamidase/pyrazinamidase
MTISISSTDALIVVDLQNDFIPGGNLAVEGGDTIISDINEIMKTFNHAFARIIFTQDWHPADHRSFASRHERKKPFDPIDGVTGIGPVLWPDHCVRGTKGAEFHPGLDIDAAHLILRKGIHRDLDSYSVFTEHDRKTDTGLAGYLENAGLKRIFLCGLALDYCVFWSAMDGKRKGFDTFVVSDLCKGIADETTETAKTQMASQGIPFVKKTDF